MDKKPQKWNNGKPYVDNKQPQREQNKDQRDTPKNVFNKISFVDKWITEGADESLVEYANEMGRYMAPQNKADRQCLSKSQIRNIYGEIKRIQLKGIKKDKASFILLKAKVAYAEGRNKTMGLSLFKMIFDKAWEVTCKELNSIEDDNKQKQIYENFCSMLEAILAYQTAYGGKD